jgi:ABC-2 type transport system ATP-binding protein
MVDSTLSVQDMTIRYGPLVAVDSLCLQVHPGEVFGLLGPNGSGKSSTLSAIAGHLTPRTGTIRVCGIDPGCRPRDYRQHLGLVPQDLAFYEDLSASANLSFFGKLYGLTGRWLQQRVGEVFELVGLNPCDKRPVRLYSGGMQRRLNLACALLHRPALLLLDEPTVGLDLLSRDTIFATLRTLRTEGTAMIFTTHHMEEVELLCDRIGIMDRGRLIGLGSLADLLGQEKLAVISARLRVDAGHTKVAGPNLQSLFRQLTARSQRDACETL